MTTPNAGEVMAVPELSRPICAVKSTLRPKRGQPSPFAGRMATPRCSAQAVTMTTPRAMRQKALQSGGTLSTPMRIEMRLPPQRMETRIATTTLRVESGSIGAEAERKILLSRGAADYEQGRLWGVMMRPWRDLQEGRYGCYVTIDLDSRK